MLSLYIHIPFCDQKCGYCSFQVIPNNVLDNKNTIFEKYTDEICDEIIKWSKNEEFFGTKNNIIELKTIYFGGGTPYSIGKDNIIKIMATIEKNYNCEFIEEISIELNPYPEDEILDFIKTFQQKYKHYPRIRRSIGLQTMDTEILKDSGRAYSFPGIVDFLRKLRECKFGNTIFNFDFIAFGKFNLSKKGNRSLRDSVRLKFFEDFVFSGFADSFSLYTLELFAGSDRYQQQKNLGEKENGIGSLKKYGTEDDVYEEFSLLKDIIIQAGYKRYEISNFALIGKESIHNKVYRNVENYIGIGTSASSFWKISNSKAKRRSNTHILVDYCKKNYINNNKNTLLNTQDLIIEEFFLRLRTREGINNIEKYKTILVNNREEKTLKYHKEGLLIYDKLSIKLTDQGMDLFNSLVVELLEII